MKDLLSLSIKGLFGRFNYDIDFQANDGFTILAAPNSFGKSTILKLIKAALKGNALYFYPVAFEELNLRFKDMPEDLNESGKSDVLKDDSGKIIDLQVKKILGDDPVIQFNYLDKSFCLADSTVKQIEKYVDDHLENVERYSGNGETFAWWMRKNQDSGEILNVADIVTCFSEGHYKEIIETYIPWMEEFQNDFQSSFFYFVKGLYNALESLSSFLTPAGMKSVFSNALNRCYVDLHEAMDARYEHSAEMVEVAMKNFMDVKNHSTRRLFNHVMQCWLDVVDLYLKPKDCLCPVFEPGESGYLSLEAVKPLNTDNREELMGKNVIISAWRVAWDETIGDVYRRFSAVGQALNKMLFFKKIRFGGRNVMEIFDEKTGKVLPLQCLSSGEEQIIATLGIILYDWEASSTNLLVIMDEPETSLHPAWQEELVNFCYKANQQFGKRFIFASHSPIFIGNYTDHMVDLYKQGIEGN